LIDACPLEREALVQDIDELRGVVLLEFCHRRAPFELRRVIAPSLLHWPWPN